MAEAPSKKENSYIEAVGRRKTSVARVRLFPAKAGGISVNDKNLRDYFVSDDLKAVITGALKAVAAPEHLAASIHVRGGGIHSQAEAIRHGLARALSKFDAPTYKKTIKGLGFLTRDARMKERRKFGLKKARKAPQWSKR